MKLSILAALATVIASASAQYPPPANQPLGVGCTQNNCNRAVNRTWNGTDTYNFHLALCASANACSSTPAATVTTATVTVTAGTVTVPLARITQQPNSVPAANGPTCNLVTAVPADQANCPDVPNYLSACSCLGYGPSTLVAPTPAVTATVFATMPAQIVYV